MKNINRHICLLAAILLLFSACKVGQRYQAPNYNLPDNYRLDSNGTDTLENLAYVNWREFFTDSSLVKLIDAGLSNNYDMRTAILNIQIANRQLNQSKAGYLPELDATIAGIGQEWRSKNYYGGPASKIYEGKDAKNNLFKTQSQYLTTLNLSWEIDIWGKISSQKEEALANYLGTAEAKNAIQTSLIANIATGYFNLLKLDAQIEVALRNVQLNDSTLRMIQLQFDAGEITSLAIQQTQSQRLLAASLVPQLEQEIQIQENALLELTGSMPDKIERGKSLKYLIDESKISLGSPLNLIRNRPDIREAEFDLIAANAQINIKQSLRYPSLTLGGTLGVNSMLPENWFNIPGSLLGSALGNLTMPIFKNKKLKTDYEVAKLESEKAEIALQKTVLRSVNEVSNSFTSLSKLKEQLVLAEARVDNSHLAVKNASLLFKSGYATYLEVITAQSNALTSELNLVSIKQSQLDSFVELYKSLGGGWSATK
ncbi:TolC family protein [Sphingobacterium faecium]|uniref:TolC family protein n=2 Tax=Sphingobacterium TaxID=28453 RepID=UPI0024693927|nr:TolC family protein [Sphingobacterium faecium]MDH5827672.1 TolC family protein [Sphingobacterium faecium]